MLLDPLSALIRLHDLQTRDYRSEVERERARREIDRCLEELTPELLEEYRRRVAKFGRSTVVPMERNTCSGCNMVLPTTGLKEVAEDVHVCSSCNRLIYDPDFVMDFV
jgi:predicted  nucleic acid-binding Zn-ribbon protein